jgi:hypothetical protein
MDVLVVVFGRMEGWLRVVVDEGAGGDGEVVVVDVLVDRWVFGEA